MIKRPNAAHPTHPTQPWLAVILLLFSAGLPFLALFSSSASAQSGSWSKPLAISKRPGYAWYPEVAVDPFGGVHVTYSKTTPDKKTSYLVEQIFYTRLANGEWLESNDIVPPSNTLERSAIAFDSQARLHMLSGGSPHSALSTDYQQAPAAQAWDSRAWSALQRLNQGSSSMGDLAVDTNGVIHVVYDDKLKSFSDIYYRRSTDGGITWSDPLNLFSEIKTSSAKPAIRVDASGAIHVTWDEGWDMLTNTYARRFHSIYMNSNDGGQSWSEPLSISYPGNKTAQLTAAADGKGRVLLVWRATGFEDRLYYQLSQDGGLSWGETGEIEGLYARPWTVSFDSYDMVSDSAGNFHLLVVGRELADVNAEQGVYHLTFDGSAWLPPEKIYSSTDRLAAHPRLALQNGNRLHAVWFTQEVDLWDPTANRFVWYASRDLDAPFVAAVIEPTATALPPTATPTLLPTATTQPTLAITSTGPEVFREHDYLGILLVGIAPAAILLGVVIAVRQVIQGIKRR